MAVSKKRKKKVSSKASKVGGVKDQIKRLEKKTEGFRNEHNLKIGDYEKNVSQMMSEFTKDMTESAETDEEVKRAVEFAIIAWNTSVIMKRQGNDSALKQVIEALKQQELGKEDVLEKDLKILIDRKNEMFPNEDVLIANYDISFSKDGSFSLSVASIVNS
ncbi:MAG: hypothetical protein U0354_12805 [Candidatus Sericytochromatia bacterium]